MAGLGDESKEDCYGDVGGGGVSRYSLQWWRGWIEGAQRPARRVREGRGA